MCLLVTKERFDKEVRLPKGILTPNPLVNPIMNYLKKNM